LWQFCTIYGNVAYFVAIWYILWQWVIFCGNLVHFMDIWYILGHLVYFPVLVCLICINYYKTAKKVLLKIPFELWNNRKYLLHSSTDLTPIFYSLEVTFIEISTVCLQNRHSAFSRELL
jgi:hypothetical protein